MAKKSGGISASDVRRVKKVMKKAKKNPGFRNFLIFIVIVALIIAAVYFLHVKGYITLPFVGDSTGDSGTRTTATTVATTHGGEVHTIESDELTINFLELGNWYTGDCTFIKAGDTDILIDAGSRTGSIETISKFIDGYCTDGILEYVIVTHAHQDHYAGFAGTASIPSIFDRYECEVVIDFALSNNQSSSMYKKYQTNLAKEVESGAVHYTAAQCIESGNDTFSLADGIDLTILDSYYYYNKSSDENNYSVCCMITQGEHNFLFTGDLEKEGEEHLVQMNDLPEVDVFKGGHHGSKTSSNDCLLSVIRPDVVCVCCCCGSDEYTDVNDNQFPTQAFIDRVSKYTDRVYVTTLSTDNDSKTYTSMNGNITVHSKRGTQITLSFSGNDIKLKDTSWFKKNRTTPPDWA